MTVSYQYKVASSTSGGFTRLLFMWRGSLYKLIYRELFIFLIIFGILSAVYRNLMTDDQKIIFEKMVGYCNSFIELIPLTFILGFYVAYVAARWWQQYEAIPWPDKCMHTMALYISGNDEHTRIVRRTLMRYLNLTLVLILRSISSAVKKRFPTLDHLTEVGFMTQTEKQMFLAIPNCDFNTYWVPCAWFVHVLKDLKAENPNIDPMGIKLLMEEFNEFRGKCGMLWSYDWISIPLVYTQVVTLATYSFFLVALVGRQYVEHSVTHMQMKIDVYLPVFTILQFFFFMGLLKVAEQMINPFGDDDEDFELNWLIDRHTKVAYLGVDTLMLHRPPLTIDKYFHNADLMLPYTSASLIYKKETYRGSFHNMQVPEDQQDMYLPEIIEEDSDADVSAPLPRERRQSIFVNVLQRRASGDQMNMSPLKKRRVSMFINPFNRKPSMDQRYVEKNTNTIKSASKSLGNGIKGIKYKSTTPWVLDFDGINAVSTKGIDIASSPRRPVAKHNSMLNTPRTCKSNWGSVKEKRRRSVPTLNTINQRRNSLAVDNQWKGVRWKPLLRVEQPMQMLNVDNLQSGTESNQAGNNECSFVNRAFTNSPRMSRSPHEIVNKNSSEVQDSDQGVGNATCRNLNCDKKSTKKVSGEQANINVIVHRPTDDSPV